MRENVNSHKTQLERVFCDDDMNICGQFVQIGSHM